ncbi:TIGR03915 family putative DNA repair protein [Ornithobacterium rhinotracheale]|uniref:DUF4130 domain-containing protein n=1 Tax=Ornithobacterium rhinotracheale (strain ATCC 51463 / DSM 15997 / CCUG 23171 / CIP 104009 / LMG 9086) TaxID=867902 RepID=I4A3A9_ORNRL|nr:TIGR03915 family putative DNA repair protein [Ornithobacterium rhinotracheale]AFL98443.1 hypothetical protein Ornrh_2313 [Ornithobacterium rhinotracheale DSM 15997]AIQ00174.1 uracil-DNA glycosylase [Ornithobacterium rhinotracheale ORT-UMN 88]KGB65762.1 uracil-DNA glycosylase [Ornithobacterium rhinotracheale H06-030791]MCK0193209.1 TIGR03915 family putative DNA repair protein [Ornithobacterium rhinotracheale]MCK0200820.1 TIGR03915 family putative DNA repair protein [Ornithobacterium rhinotra
MINLVYDGSFEGLMTAIFEVFEYRFQSVCILPENRAAQLDLFAERHDVITQTEKAERVLKKLEENLGKKGISQLMYVFMSELDERENLILHLVQKSVKNPKKYVFNDLADDQILAIAKICKSVGREVHRMKAFVRFEKLQDETYFARIEPDFDVLPMLKNHFYHRYRDQKWLIYDARRNYGLFYDLETCEMIFPTGDFAQNPEDLWHTEEQNYQKLWQRYFVKTGIEECKNTKLHLQNMPKRYWKYLTEKKIY